MKTKLLYILRTWPVYLILLPLFFVWHGYVENRHLVTLDEAGSLLLIYCGSAIVLFMLCRLFIRNNQKAGIAAFILLFFQFFFGAIHDALKQILPGSFITKYSFILPLLFVFIIGVFLFLKKTNKQLNRFILYLNAVLLILILTDTVMFISQKSQKETTALPGINELKKCDTCSKPDIYLIVADGYPGKQQLKDLFDFDNSPFEKELKKRNFHVVDSSTSNYNFTMFSVASTLNMDYLAGIKGRNSDKHNISVCFSTIKNSQTLSYLEKNGYELINGSMFGFKHQPAAINPTFIPAFVNPIVSQTLLYRIKRDLSYHLATTLKLKSVLKKWRTADLHNNKKIEELTRRIPETTSSSPRFIYSHFVMPHWPYYYDSTGKETHYTRLTEEYAFNTGAFISYLKYANKMYLALIDHILSVSKKPPVIIFMSDHGFREMSEPVAEKYQFMNLNAVYLPSGDYSGFYSGQSNVNQFRILFNKLFHQKLPLLKDSLQVIID